MPGYVFVGYAREEDIFLWLPSDFPTYGLGLGPDLSTALRASPVSPSLASENLGQLMWRLGSSKVLSPSVFG